MRYYDNGDVVMVMAPGQEGVPIPLVNQICCSVFASGHQGVGVALCRYFFDNGIMFSAASDNSEKINMNDLNRLKELVMSEGIQIDPNDFVTQAQGFSIPEDSPFIPLLDALMGLCGDGEEEDVEEGREDLLELEESMEEEAGLFAYRKFASVSDALDFVKRFRLEHFYIFESDNTIFLGVRPFTGTLARVHDFIPNKYLEVHLREHGTCYYDNCSYKEVLL